MKKLSTLLILIVLLATGNLMGQHPNNATWPTYNLILKNDSQLTANSFKFDVYIKATDPTINIDLYQFQLGIIFNNNLFNSGTITPTMNFTGSILPTSMRPTSISLPTSGNKNCIKVGAKAGPGYGALVITNAMGESKLLSIILTNTVTFPVGQKPDLTFNFTNSPYPTKVFHNTSSTTNVNLTLPITNQTILSWHTTNQLFNPWLNAIITKYNLTGSGSYCQGGLGKDITLSNSDTTNFYQLYKDGMALGNRIKGTGNQMIWSNNTIGSYYIIGNRAGTYITDTMNGTVTITEINGIPNTPGAIVGNNLACQGNNNAMYYIPQIPNADTYNWAYSGTGATITGINDTVYLSFAANATSGNLTVNGINGCGNGPSSTAFAITVNDLPGAAGTITGPATVSPGNNNIAYSVPAITSASTYTWAYSGTGATINGTSNAITINFAANATPGYLTVKGVNNCGEGTISQQFLISMNSIPAAAGVIQGTSSVCQNANNVMYKVDEILGASTYTWTYTGTGATLNTTAGDTIYVNFSNAATSGDLTVFGVNGAGDGATSPVFSITVGTPPANASGISGTQSVCKNTSQWYKANPIAGATSYVWTLPTGTTGTSSIDSINVTFSSTAVNGKIYVYGQNSCGIGGNDSVSITVNTVPSAAGAITGTTTLCQGTSGLTYSTSPISGATSYTWVIPTNATIVGTNNTNTITLDFGNTAQSGNISVKGQNQCGFGTQSLQYITVNPLPGTPTSMTGVDSVCQGSAGNTYSIANLSGTGTNGYAWTLPTGFTGTSTTNSITINIANNAVSGTLKVKGTNGCGSGQEFSKAIVVKPLPSNPGTIIGSATVCKGTSNIVYKVNPVANALSYIWTLPNGITGTSSIDSIVVAISSNAVAGPITVKGVNACGDGPVSTLNITVKDIPDAAGSITGTPSACQGSANNVYSVPLINQATTYTWTLPSGITGTSTSNAIALTFGASFTSGTITVAGTNICGSGTPASFPITGISAPVAAGTITGTDIICQGQSNLTYSVPVVSGANNYIWTLPTGFTGTSTTNTITVNAGANALSGNITVKGNNSCGSGTASSKALTVQLLPDNAGIVTGPMTACKGTNGITYTVPAIANATSYVWTLPNGITGTSSTNTINVNVTNSAVSGNISVKGINSCGNGVSSSIYVMVYGTPAAAGTISGPTTICGNQTGITYTVPTINDATSYVWTFPNGFTGVSNTNIITVDISASAASGPITVKGINTCGMGTASTLNVTVNQSPANAGTISGSATVCQGQTNVTYTVPTIANAASYVWTLPNGFTGTSSTNSITVSVSTNAIDGTITVKGTNSCGDGASSSINITVNTLPSTPGTIVGTSTVSVANQPFTYQISPVANATDYLWEYTGNGASISGTGNSVSVTFSSTASSGNLKVKAHNACGYSATSPNFPISITIGVEETDVTSINIYPNPNRGKFNIDLGGIKHNVILTVYDAQGKVFYNELIGNTTPDYSKVMDLSGVKAGLYFVKISSDNMTKIEKVIIQ